GARGARRTVRTQAGARRRRPGTGTSTPASRKAPPRIHGGGQRRDGGPRPQGDDATARPPYETRARALRERPVHLSHGRASLQRITERLLRPHSSAFSWLLFLRLAPKPIY